MSLKIGSRIFAPRPFITLLTVVLLGLLLALGRWQLQRAAAKQVLFDAFGNGSDATVQVTSHTPAVPRYQHIEAGGTYDATRQILIDNMFDAQGHAGYFVITPFALTQGGWLLVNRGWVPLGAGREDRPVITVGDGVRRIRGRADNLPRPGYRMGEHVTLAPPYPVVANFPQHAEIEQLMRESIWTPATEVLLLDAAETDGYVRQWQAPGLPPMRHIAYAVQWFGLALALFVIFIVTNLHRAVPRPASRDVP